MITYLHRVLFVCVVFVYFEYFGDVFCSCFFIANKIDVGCATICEFADDVIFMGKPPISGDAISHYLYGYVVIGCGCGSGIIIVWCDIIIWDGGINLTCDVAHGIYIVEIIAVAVHCIEGSY